MSDRISVHAEVMAACARAIVRSLGMQAENQVRASLGQAIAYDSISFERVIDQEGLQPEGIAQLFRMVE